MHTYMMGGTAEGLTVSDMEAAQQLVHLSSDEEECDTRSRVREAKVVKAAVQFGGGEGAGKGTTEAKSRAEGDEGNHGGDDDDKSACPRKRRFRSIAYIYKVTRPVRLHDHEAKRRKNH